MIHPDALARLEALAKKMRKRATKSADTASYYERAGYGQLAHRNAVAAQRSREDAEALTAILAERTALVEALDYADGMLAEGLSFGLVDQDIRRIRARIRAAAVLGGGETT